MSMADDAEVVSELLDAGLTAQDVSDDENVETEDELSELDMSDDEPCEEMNTIRENHKLPKICNISQVCHDFVLMFGFGLIYRAFCRKTKKSYIGQTIQQFKKRIGDHFSAARNRPKGAFHLALRKYGAEAFEWEILMVTNVNSLNHFEEMFISGFGSLTPNGYNIMSKSEYAFSGQAKGRRKEEDADLPRYISSRVSISENGTRSCGYICKLPNGKTKQIMHNSVTMEKKLELIKEWMAVARKDSSNTTRKRVTSATGVNDLPLGMYLEMGKGYYIQVKGYPKKKFCKQTMTMTEKKQSALAYLEYIVSPRSTPDYEKYRGGVKMREEDKKEIVFEGAYSEGSQSLYEPPPARKLPKYIRYRPAKGNRSEGLRVEITIDKKVAFSKSTFSGTFEQKLAKAKSFVDQAREQGII